MSPAQQHYATELDKTRQKQQNIDQSGFLGQLLQGIASQGDDVGFADIMSKIHGNPDISPENKQNLSKQFGEHYSKKEIEKGKKKEESQQANINALADVQRGREIIKTGHIGPVFKVAPGKHGRDLSSYFNPSEGARLRSEMDAIKSGLVQALAPLKITNRPEFEHYSKLLEDPNLSQEELLGVFDYIENKFKRNLPQQRGEGSNIPGSPEGWRSQNEKPQGDMVYVKHPKTGEPFPVPRGEFEANRAKHPELLEVQNQ